MDRLYNDLESTEWTMTVWVSYRVSKWLTAILKCLHFVMYKYMYIVRACLSAQYIYIKSTMDKTIVKNRIVYSFGQPKNYKIMERLWEVIFFLKTVELYFIQENIWQVTNCNNLENLCKTTELVTMLSASRRNWIFFSLIQIRRPHCFKFSSCPPLECVSCQPSKD